MPPEGNWVRLPHSFGLHPAQGEQELRAWLLARHNAHKAVVCTAKMAVCPHTGDVQTRPRPTKRHQQNQLRDMAALSSIFYTTGWSMIYCLMLALLA